MGNALEFWINNTNMKMKKKYLSLLALPFLMASCAEDIDVFGGATDGTLPISFTLGTPSGMNTTRGTSDQGAFDNIDWSEYDLRYQLEVYETSDANPTSGALVTTRRVRTVNEEGAITIDDIRLTPNRQYTFVVWADLVKEGSTADLHYNTNVGEKTDGDYQGLQNITIKNWGINDETRDAYFIVQTQTVTSADPISLTLKRPFAKLRVVTTDVEHLKLYTFPNFTKVAYKQGAARPSTFNALTGVASGAMNVFESGAAPVQYDGESSEAGQADGLNQNLDKTLFVDYIFAKEGEQTAVQFDLSAYEGDGDDADSRLIRTYEFITDIPVKRNYLTTIKGNVLTNGTEFEISVDDAFAGNIDFPVLSIKHSDYASDEAAGQALFDAVKNAEHGAIIHLTPGTYYGTDGNTSRYTISKDITIIGDGDDEGDVILSSAKYGRVIQCDNPEGITVTLKNLTLQGGLTTSWGHPLYIKNYATVNLENVTMDNSNTNGIAILLDACNTINGAYPSDVVTTVNAKNVTIESGCTVELNTNPCSSTTQTVTTKAYFNFEDCDNINIVQPQSPCAALNPGNNMFVNGTAIPNGMIYVHGLGMVAKGNSVLVSTAAELTAATQDATQDITIYLAQDITGDAIAYQKEGIDVVINGLGYKYDGTIAIHGRNAGTSAETIVIQNIEFESSAKKTFITQASNSNASHSTTYAHNITIEDCTFSAPEYNEEIGAINFNTPYYLTVQRCTATNLHSLLQAQSCDNTVVVDHVTVTNCKNGVSFGNTKTATLTNSIINAKQYGVRGDGNTARVVDGVGSQLSVSGTTITAKQPIVIRKITAGCDYRVALTDATLSTSEDWDVVFTKGQDDAAYEIPAGTFSITGAENYAVYPSDVAKIGNTKYTSLAAAINAAQSGETIEISGTSEGTFTVNKNITIKSADANKKATIKGRLYIQNANPIFEGVIFDRNTEDSDNDYEKSLGYTNCLQYKAVVMIYGNQSNTIKFKECKFLNNRGVHKSAITNVACELMIDGCYFEGTSSSIYSQANLSITNSTFSYTGTNNVIANINGCGDSGGKFIFKGNKITGDKIFALSQFLSTVGFGNGTYHFDVQNNEGSGFEHYFLNTGKVTNKTFADGSETF